MLKKNLSIIVIVLMGLLLVTVVIWVHNKRIARIETNMKSHR